MGVVSAKVGVVKQACVCVCAPPPPRKKILYETLHLLSYLGGWACTLRPEGACISETPATQGKTGPSQSFKIFPSLT